MIPLHPHGHICGFGNYPKWRSKIYPFRDRPDVPLDVIWYSVPDTNPCLPHVTVFTDRFWEAKTSQSCAGGDRCGMVGSGYPEDWHIWRQPIPDVPIAAPEGTPDQWLNGFDYSVWQAGGYANAGPCAPSPTWSDVVLAPARAAHQATSAFAWDDHPMAEGRTVLRADSVMGYVDFPDAPAAAVHAGGPGYPGASLAPGRAAHAGGPGYLSDIPCPAFAGHVNPEGYLTDIPCPGLATHTYTE